MGPLARNSILVLSLLLSVGMLTGCKDKVKETSSSSDDGGGTDPSVPAPSATAAAPMALKIYTKYFGMDYANTLKFAETGTDTCTATAASPVVTCTVNVEEGRLYYSSVNFKYSWLPTSCKMLIFQPYFYQASVSNAYIGPSQTSALDCSVAPLVLPSGCYGGAAVDLVPEFPKYWGLINFPLESALGTVNTNTVTLASAYAKKSNSNRTAASDLPTAKVGTTFTSAQLGNIGDGYVGGSFVNYQFTCSDDYDDSQPYIINLKINDVDSAPGNPTINTYKSWKDAP